jgi:N-acetylglucosaminyldiphosphoundecaprenol N-acetyl-beta-D-mannosaminyltransferase
VLVALGCPKQERLIEVMRPQMPRAWFIGIGITFSFVAGEVHRAPMWMRGIGLEWVHRLMQEPGRLARRYLVDGLPFAIRLLAVSAIEGLRRRVSPPLVRD